MSDITECVDSDASENTPLINLTRKRKSFGRVQDAAKKIRNHTYETGKPCNCRRFKCFSIITVNQRKDIITRFNKLHDRNEQNNHLCGLISIQNIKRRRPRKHEAEANLRDNSFVYKVRVLNEVTGQFKVVQICQLAFINLHGITNRRVITLKKHLKSGGSSCRDKRGTHLNRPHKLTKDRLESIHKHINSFKGRKSHYSLKDSRRIYLPESLNIKKMHQMYVEQSPSVRPVSYETYRNIFFKDFNIGFGYPRSDTCSYCDATKVKVESLESKLRLVQSGTEDEPKLKADLKRVEAEAKLHKLRAATFYIRKRIEKKKSRKSNDYEAITMDYCKNLPTPNITTNDVYYKRQLTFISFNIHVLSSNQSVFYTYPQTIAKKGADDVMSLLYHFCAEVLPTQVRHLRIFCDSCAGQNKNFTLVRFLHYLVHGKQRFDSIEVIFPMRGHSYLESDKDFGLINQKTVAEVPSQWVEIFKTARVKPQPFNVYECTQEMFHAWTKFLSSYYRKSCPFPTRPIRVLQCIKNHPRTVAVRETAYNSTAVNFVIAARNAQLPLNAVPNMLYHELLPIPKLKYQQHVMIQIEVTTNLT